MRERENKITGKRRERDEDTEVNLKWINRGQWNWPTNDWSLHLCLNALDI